jgi:hypothetical protein
LDKIDRQEAPMAKHSRRILELARTGAEHRYQELKEEIAALVKDFPHLAERAGAVAGRAAGKAEATLTRTVRRGRGMSAAARKAVSERMRAYWAARRKAKAGKKR